MSSVSRLRTVAVGAAATALVAVVAAPSQAATLTSGHIDGFDIDASATALSLSIKTYSPADDDVAPAGTVLDVPAAALTTVPSGTSYACLGASGSSVYVLPQSESTASSLGTLWAGWNTEGVPASGPASVSLELDVAGSTFPAGGRFALYTTSLSTATFRLNSNATSSCTKSTFAINRNTHAHGNWAFTAPGTYTLRLRATATGLTASAWQTYTFDVG